MEAATLLGLVSVFDAALAGSAHALNVATRTTVSINLDMAWSPVVNGPSKAPLE